MDEELRNVEERRLDRSLDRLELGPRKKWKLARTTYIRSLEEVDVETWLVDDDVI